MFKRDKVHAGLDFCPVLMRVVNLAQPARIPDLPFTPDDLRILTAPKKLTATAVEATSCLCLLLVMLDGSLPGRRLSADSAPVVDSAKSFGVKEDPLHGSVLGDRDWWGRATSIAGARPPAVVKYFLQQ